MRLIEITQSEINHEEVMKKLCGVDTGCIVSFRGIVRGESQGRNIREMRIEVYPERAISVLKDIRDEIKDLYKINEVSIVHRYGAFDVGDDIVLIAVSAGHRAEAFTACRYVIDELKKRVPIGKKEYTTEGEYKVPEGKLIVAETVIQGDKISKVKITGDFFMHPKESIKDLENSLRGTPVWKIDEVVEGLFQNNDITIFGVSPSDFSHVLGMCIES